MDTEPNQNFEAKPMPTSLIEKLQQQAKYKERSSATHDTHHAPLLVQNKPITCLLLGHSFFERFKTTGASTVFGPDQAPYPEYFNAGVGGDQICNVIYRLTEKGLLESLQKAGVQYALLAMGTNDLKNDKRPLSNVHIEQYRLVIEALQQACPGVKILVCGIAPKKRLGREGIVEESNIMLSKMVQDFEEDSIALVEFLPTDPDLVDNLEPDGVHLNVQGYDIFAKALWGRYQDMRSRYQNP